MKLFTNIALIALILLQTVGMTFSRHYCMMQPADWSISMTGEMADCGMHQTVKKSGCDTEMKVTKSYCCNTEVSFLQLDDDINQPVHASFDLLPVLFFIVTITLFSLFRSLFTHRLPKGYVPPLLFRKRLLQRLSFLQIFRN